MSPAKIQTKKKKKPLSANETFWGYFFLFPIIIGFLLFTVVPVIMSFYYSLTNYDGILPPQFVGFANYAKLFTNEEFGQSLMNTIYFAVGTVPVGVFLAIIVAALLNQKIRGLGIYRSAFFIPVIVSFVSVAMVWQWMYSQDYGLINAFLGKLGLYQPPWIASEQWAMPSVIIMSIWKSLGFNSVILLAGIQGISPSVYEAADIDGANIFHKFFKITLPLLKPTIMFVIIISMINSLQAFDQIYIMTNGGPGKATQVVCYLIYMNAFQYFKQGYASAMAYVLFIIIFVASIFQLKASEKSNV
ncbi:MAG: sugar ABC transporter permease [Oscillospiraceae bacterium]